MTNGKRWFRAKRYGWGWYPVSVEGWIVTLVYVALLVSIFRSIDAYSHSNSDTLINFALPFIGLTSLLLSICYVKGEWPHFQWGSEMPEASKIWKKIRESKSILLHCHPSPDPDSVGSVLSMKFALESIGKKVTVIQGDSELPEAFLHFPGATQIEKKNFGEVDLKNFDLFIILDSGSPEMVSRKSQPVFPLSIPTAIIDHPGSNVGYADVNLIAKAPSTTFLLYKLFKEWKIEITPEIAANLFIGMFTDTGGFKFPPSDHTTFEAAAELVKIYPGYIELISKMENSQDKDSIYGQALALNSIQTFCDDRIAISTVSHAALSERKISTDAISGGHIANILKSVVGWEIGISMVEVEPNRIKLSFRTRDAQKYEVAKLAVAIGGGGHKAAAGAVLNMTLEEAISKVVETAKVLYNL